MYLKKIANVMNDHLPGFQMQVISCYFITLMLLINENNMYIPILYIKLSSLLNVLNYYYNYNIIILSL